MDIYQKLINKETKLSLIGLGYVGLPIALEFAKHIPVIGFDISEERVSKMKKGIDPSGELGPEGPGDGREKGISGRFRSPRVGGGPAERFRPGEGRRTGDGEGHALHEGRSFGMHFRARN